MSHIISIVSMVTGSIGIFMGFYFLGLDLNLAITIVTLTTVGIAGILAFIRHVIFYRSDMQRLGMETVNPEWMFEVGFANLAFGFMGMTPLFLNTGNVVMPVTLLGYSLYLLQAAILHFYKYIREGKHDRSRLWRSVFGTLLYVAMMSYFAVYGLSHLRDL